MAKQNKPKPPKGKGRKNRKPKQRNDTIMSRRRAQRGILGDLGGMLLPGIGGPIGNLADKLIGGFLGGRGASAPLANSGRTRSNQINRSTEHGTEEIAQITVPAGTPAGTILLQSLIAAPAVGVRLRSFSQLWTKTRFNGFTVTVKSSNPATVPGNYSLAIDPDPVQSYASGPELPARLMALTVASRANAWADTAVAMRQNPIQLFNKHNTATSSDAELRQFAAGQLIMATTTPYEEECSYTVTVDWDVDFERPDTNPSEQVGEIQTYRIGPTSFGATVSTATTITASLANMAWEGGRSPPQGTYLMGSPQQSGFSKPPPDPTFGTYDITEIDITETSAIFHGVFSSGTVAPATAGILSIGAIVINVQGAPSNAKLMKIGFALVHPVYARTHHIGWFTSALQERENRLEEQERNAIMRKIRNEIWEQQVRWELQQDAVA